MTSLDARALRDLVLDPGSWKSWDSPITLGDVPGPYAAELARAAERTRQDESIITGEGLLRGRRVAVLAGEFGFLAGSIGVATARRLVAAIERATALRLPLLAAPASGGTRMQEGTLAFVQMIAVSAAVARARRPTRRRCRRRAAAPASSRRAAPAPRTPGSGGVLRGCGWS